MRNGWEVRGEGIERGSTGEKGEGGKRKKSIRFGIWRLRGCASRGVVLGHPFVTRRRVWDSGRMEDFKLANRHS